MSFKPQYFGFIIFVICFLAFQLVQDSIRPGYGGNNATVQYILGLAPNFFPAIGIPALLITSFPYFKGIKSVSGFLTSRKHIAANVISQTGLLSWEFMQLQTTKGQFDWNDILWTLIGGICFQLLWLMAPSRLKTID